MTVLSASAAVRGVLRPARRPRGISIFSILLGLVLFGLAITAAITLFNQASERQKVTAAITLLNSLKAGIESTFAGSPDYGAANADLVATIARRGLIPENALVGNGAGLADDTVRNPFGGWTTIRGNPGGGAPTAYEIQFAGVEQEVCAAMGDAYVNRNRARSGLDLMGVSTTNNTTTTATTTLTATEDAPFTRAELDGICDDITAVGVVAFRFR